ncbi:MAG: nickel pincer cofactor biosynthesis protein LarB [Planctomycetota bacterium]
MPKDAHQPATAKLDEHGLSIDLDRRRRCGFPEVVYGEGKTPDAVAAALGQLAAAGQPALATRVTQQHADATRERLPEIVHNTVARTLRLGVADETKGSVAVVTAGTTDLPVAEEAAETLLWMGVRVVRVNDVGVAGPHRLPERVEELRNHDAVVVVAGMEGALPSVVGGHVDSPIIAVPTSVGYGANLGGIAALLAMLNSCASNVSVVNIDGGFKGGYVAGLIATRAAAGVQ